MEPLAHRLRPTKLSDVIGQEYLTGKDVLKVRKKNFFTP